jgi:hypothetical protein
MNNLFSGFSGRTVFRVLLTDTLIVIKSIQITKARILRDIKKVYQFGGCLTKGHRVNDFLIHESSTKQQFSAVQRRMNNLSACSDYLVVNASGMFSLMEKFLPILNTPCLPVTGFTSVYFKRLK